MFGLGIQELLVILAIVLVIFGARRLPELGSGLGKAIKNFKGGLSSDEIDVTPRGGPTAGQGQDEAAQEKPPAS